MPVIHAFVNPAQANVSIPSVWGIPALRCHRVVLSDRIGNGLCVLVNLVDPSDKKSAKPFHVGQQ